MKITLSFSHDDGKPNPGDRVQFEKPATWSGFFLPPLIKATAGGKERLFYRVENSAYYFEAVPVDVDPIIQAEEAEAEDRRDAEIAERERGLDQILDYREETGL